VLIKLDKKDVYFRIDAQDKEKVFKYNWRLQNNNGRKYVDVVGRKHLFLHRYILNPPKNMIVDHINGDLLDNRRCNLRICTIQQNSMNRRIGKNNTSGFKGVSKIKRKFVDRWTATIEHNQKSIFLGIYKTKLKAAKAVDNAYKKYFGEFARLNIPNPVSS